MFRGLAIEQLEQDWSVYPVLHIDFSGSKYLNADALCSAINRQLALWEEIYGHKETEDTFSLWFKGVIGHTSRQGSKSWC